MSPEEIVCLLETTTPDLTARLARCSKDYEHNDGRMSGKFLYLTFRDSKATVQELIEVAYMRMANFALPKSRTEEAAQKFAANPNLADPLVQLVTEACDLFMKTKTETGRSGELGELILYMLVEWLHKAPIVACKMYLKTSHQMPIHGVDGVHIGFNGDSLIFYWGESKLHKAFASAIDDIVESVGKFYRRHGV